MTNQEWYAEEMKKASPEAVYEWLGWLMYCYAKQYTDSRLAIIEWLKQEKEVSRMECDNCRYGKMCYRRINPIGDKYSHTDNCEHYEEYEQRPHGEWVLVKPYTFACSLCGRLEEHQEPFCNCGADMRVKDELNRVNKELNCEIEKLKSEIVPDYRDGWRLKEGAGNET